MSNLAPRITRSFSATLILGCLLLTGCTPDPPVETAPLVAETTPTPTPSPTPEWKEDEQAAIDAVHAYIAKMDEIGQNLSTISWDGFYEVAGDPAVSNMIQVWFAWQDRGWHQVGAGSFTPVSSAEAKTDDRGDHYYVRGCFFVGDTHMVDSTGTRVDGPEMESYRATFTVLHPFSGGFLVIEDVTEEESC